MQFDDEESGHKRAGASARGFSEKAPKPPPYEDPVDKQAREAGSIDDRVLAIATLMAQGRWTKIKALQYGNLWAVAHKTVRDYATQANRLRKQLAGAQGLKAAARRTRDQLQAAYELAIANGDAKAATMAAKTLGELQGAFPSKRVGKDAPQQQPPGLTVPSQLSEYIDHPELLRFWTLTGQRPTPAQKKAILDGTPVEEAIQAAGLPVQPRG